jgi:hypothetical protein
MSLRRPAVGAGALPVWQRRTVYGLGIATWLTGVVWLVFKYFVRSVDAFGFENPHPQQALWLIAHAAASLLAVWLFGLLWHHHIARGWTARLRRPSGGTLFGLIAWLALSGLALYYIGDDALRQWMSLGHWILGLGGLAAFLLHDRS